MVSISPGATSAARAKAEGLVAAEEFPEWARVSGVSSGGVAVARHAWRGAVDKEEGLG
eukprot:CAMPEP_0171404396 /NCGR_PEP_ID=MMETSP0880-20121228/13670_1 /TAXON_ID=67004 /ORGANISM="Thalassiosira weissflogii, Strain CCMP1336" /LENGTH=57 /DNA_ID=CAMNT_0011919605 /DNA_START=58 /DNA_END=228 /DNA_ORIENTATION=-